MFLTADFINFCNGCDVFPCKNVMYTGSYVFYFHGCNVRAWNMFWGSVAKPVLWQLMILLPCTLTLTSSIPMGAMYLYMQERFLHSLIRSCTLWGHQFLLIGANRAVVTNNLTVIIEVMLIEAVLIVGFVYHGVDGVLVK